MVKTISSSELRIHIREVLDEVGYGGAQYIVEKFGQPTAAIISIEDFRFLQQAKEREATDALQEMLANIRARHRGLDMDALNALVEQARAEFYRLRSR